MAETREVLVTGGTGTLGRRVVESLRVADCAVRVLSRSGKEDTAQGNLLTGEGLDEAVHGVRAIVHCASSPIRKTRETDVGGTERLLRAAKRAGVSHFVFISIVGVDHNPYPYFRAKHEAEGVVENSGVPWSILRATQFHDFVLGLLRPLARLPLMPVPRGFLLQPIDAGEVANRLVEIALSEFAGRVPDIGGPEVRTTGELGRSYLRATGGGRRLLEVPTPGRAARAFREGAAICPGHAYGSITWKEFLRGQP